MKRAIVRCLLAATVVLLPLLAIAPVEASIWLDGWDEQETAKAYAYAYVSGYLDPPDYYWGVQHDYNYYAKGDYVLAIVITSSPPPPSWQAFSDIVVYVKLPGGAPVFGASAHASI